MPAIRILIVDDSIVIRRVLADALSRDSAIEVVGRAADGTIALSKIPSLKPDVVTLDIEMPGMSGLETVAAIRKLYPHLPVIMFSTLTERGGTSTLEALSLGASDYVTKPSNTGSLEETRSRIQQELIPKVKALCKRRDLVTPLSAPIVVSTKHRSGIDIQQSRASRIDVVAIGTSTGGRMLWPRCCPRCQRTFRSRS
jgi:two-component system, chemotaxis family, protein-glutamate methylesterase/glutaminase